MNSKSMNAGALNAAFARVIGQKEGGAAPPRDVPVCGEPQDSDRDYMSVNQVCKLLGVSRAKWYYLTNPRHKYHDPSIPPWKPVGRRGRKYRRDLIVAWVESCGRGGAAA